MSNEILKTFKINHPNYFKEYKKAKRQLDKVKLNEIRIRKKEEVSDEDIALSDERKNKKRKTSKEYREAFKMKHPDYYKNYKQAYNKNNENELNNIRVRKSNI